jgi:hypothetical protein
MRFRYRSMIIRQRHGNIFQDKIMRFRYRSMIIRQKHRNMFQDKIMRFRYRIMIIHQKHRNMFEGQKYAVPAPRHDNHLLWSEQMRWTAAPRLHSRAEPDRQLAAPSYKHGNFITVNLFPRFCTQKMRCKYRLIADLSTI